MNSIKILTLFLSFVLCTSIATSQETESSTSTSSVPFESGKEYILGEISVVGAQQFSEQSVKVYSGLKTGQVIKIPGDKLSSAIKKLYGTKRFSSVEVFISKIDGDTAYLEFNVTELPQISSITISGIKKSKAKDLREEADINKGDMLTDNLMVTTKNYFKKTYTDKGYLNTKVNLHTRKDTTEGNAMDLLIAVDRGKKIKIKEINFEGNKDISDAQLRTFFKDTKRKFWGRFWKSSKYIKEKYKDDLQNLLDEYSELGYRDARIISDSIVWNENDKSINLEIKLEEGIQSGKILRLKGKGLPSVNSYGTGDLLIHINVWTPQNLTKEEKQFFEASKKSETFTPNPTGNDKSFFDRVKEMFG